MKVKFKLYIDFSEYKLSKKDKDKVMFKIGQKLNKNARKIEKKHNVKCWVYFKNDDVLVFEVEGEELPEGIMRELQDWFGFEASEQDLKRFGWKEKAISLFKRKVTHRVRKAAMASLKMLGIKISYEILD